MTQQINLLEELTVLPISAYNCKLIVHIIIGWILLLALIYVITLSLYLNQKSTLIDLEIKQKNIVTIIENYKLELNAIEPAYIDGTTPGSNNFPGFSSYLKDLATFTPPGIWLKEIIFSVPDGTVILKGSTIAASGISTLLNSLSKSRTLGDKRFGTIQLDKNTDTDSADFTINNIVAATAKESDKKP